MRLVGRCSVALLLSLVLGSLLASTSAAARPWIEVATGGRGEYRWSVSLGERRDPSGARSAAVAQPCVLVASSWRSGPLEWHRSSYRECSSVPLRGAGAPLVATSMQASDSSPARVSAVGMAFAAAVRRVRITLAGGRQIVLAPRPAASRPGDRSAGQLRYVAFTIRGEWCAERITSFAINGAELWDSGSDGYVCGEAPSPPAFE